MRGWNVNLYDELLARENLAKARANADAAKLQADAGLAEIEECRNEMRQIFAQFMHHLESLGFAFKPSGETLQ
jgi:hypothetical protein